MLKPIHLSMLRAAMGARQEVELPTIQRMVMGAVVLLAMVSLNQVHWSIFSMGVGQRSKLLTVVSLTPMQTAAEATGQGAEHPVVGASRIHSSPVHGSCTLETSQVVLGKGYVALQKPRPPHNKTTLSSRES